MIVGYVLVMVKVSEDDLLNKVGYYVNKNYKNGVDGIRTATLFDTAYDATVCMLSRIIDDKASVDYELQELHLLGQPKIIPVAQERKIEMEL